MLYCIPLTAGFHDTANLTPYTWLFAVYGLKCIYIYIYIYACINIHGLKEYIVFITIIIKFVCNIQADT